jgi:hypothetical protein
VVATRHPEWTELVAATIGTDIVIAEHPCDLDARASGPAEALRPVRAEDLRIVGVVVVAERDQVVRRVTRLEASNRGAETALRLTADAEIADGDQPDRPLLNGLSGLACSGQDQNKAQKDNGAAHRNGVPRRFVAFRRRAG